LEDKILNAMKAVDADWTANAAENASLPLIRDLMSYADVLQVRQLSLNFAVEFLRRMVSNRKCRENNGGKIAGRIDRTTKKRCVAEKS
jgi:hypothetical protein